MIKKRLIGLLKDSKKYIVQNVLWQWLGLLAQIAAILVVGQFLDTAIFGSVTSREILTTGMVCAISIIIRMVSDKKASKASFLASADVKRVLREKIYEKLVRLGASYKEQISTSEVVQLSVEGVEPVSYTHLLSSSRQSMYYILFHRFLQSNSRNHLFEANRLPLSLLQ